jgi:dUTP pyrophosphatase
MITVNFRRLKTDAMMPTKGSKKAACFDAYLPQNYTPLIPGETRIVPLGFAVEVPDGYELQVRPRSGLASKGMTVANSPGCVDSDFRGEVGVILMNLSNMIMPLNKGDRVCQLKLALAPEFEFVEVDIIEETERGTGGFGHTGGSQILSGSQDTVLDAA